jgi:hypothetical protein
MNVIKEEDGGGNTTSGIDIAEVPFGAMKRRKLKTFLQFTKGKKKNGKTTRKNNET